jgi:hypothetical protein
VRLLLTVSDTITAAGGRLTFTAVPVDGAGAPVPADPVEWSVSRANRGRVTSAGAFTGGPNPGLVYVRARLAEPPLSDSVAVLVVVAGTVKWSWAAAEAGGVLPDMGGPALAGDGTIYVLVTLPDPTNAQTFSSTLVALTPQGVVRWTRTLTEVEGSTGVVVVPGTGRLWLVGKRAYLLTPTGDVLWDTLPYTRPPPLFKAGAATTSLLVATMGERPLAFRAEDQTVLWEGPYAPFSSWLVPPTITSDGERVLAKRTSDTLFVFDARDGTILHRFLDPDTSADKRVFGRGTVPVGDRYYLPTQGRLAAYDTSGPLHWLTEDTGNGVTEPAVAPDGTLYVQNRRWGLHALNPDGSTRWYRATFIPPSGPYSERPRWFFHGGLALAEGGVLYGAGFDRFYACDVNGHMLWFSFADSAGVRQSFIGAPAIAPDGTVYSYTSTHLYAFWASAPPEPNSPWPMWRHDAQRTGWAGYTGN